MDAPGNHFGLSSVGAWLMVFSMYFLFFQHFKEAFQLTLQIFFRNYGRIDNIGINNQGRDPQFFAEGISQGSNHAATLLTANMRYIYGSIGFIITDNLYIILQGCL